MNSDYFCPDYVKDTSPCGLHSRALLTVIGTGSASTEESVPPSTTTTVVEQFDEETGIIWSQINETTIKLVCLTKGGRDHDHLPIR